MLNFRKKDKDGRQVRVEHRGRHSRASRTGGVALRAEKKLGSAKVTASTSEGVRVSRRIAKGARVAFQNSRFQLIGRWQTGPLNFNLSKTGVTASAKTGMGTFNLFKPKRSSFKFAGIQFRGKKAAELQAFYMIFNAAVMAVVFGVQLAIFVLRLLWRMILFALWLSVLVASFLRDFVAGFVSEVRNK